MSWQLSFNVSHDEVGKVVVEVTNEYGAPEGAYSVAGHILNDDEDWGESVSVATPIGYVSASTINPKIRGDV